MFDEGRPPRNQPNPAPPTNMVEGRTVQVGQREGPPLPEPPAAPKSVTRLVMGIKQGKVFIDMGTPRDVLVLTPQDAAQVGTDLIALAEEADGRASR
jgi:hypothetical protein